MTPSEQLHLDASAYANKRIAMHKEAIKQQKQTPLDERVHNGTWLAHYEGYVAGYEAQRTWVGLPQGIVGWMSDWDLWEYARAVLAKFKEKNT
jgi:hypothetical protein